jgi:hypothetical protein
MGFNQFLRSKIGILKMATIVLPVMTIIAVAIAMPVGLVGWGFSNPYYDGCCVLISFSVLCFLASLIWTGLSIVGLMKDSAQYRKLDLIVNIVLFGLMLLGWLVYCGTGIGIGNNRNAFEHPAFGGKFQWFVGIVVIPLALATAVVYGILSFFLFKLSKSWAPTAAPTAAPTPSPSQKTVKATPTPSKTVASPAPVQSDASQNASQA